MPRSWRPLLVALTRCHSPDAAGEESTLGRPAEPHHGNDAEDRAQCEPRKRPPPSQRLCKYRDTTNRDQRKQETESGLKCESGSSTLFPRRLSHHGRELR